MKRMLALLLLAVFALAPAVALAASPAMPSISTPVYPIAFTIGGTRTASQAGVIAFRAPFTLRALYLTVVVAAKGGTQGTSTLTCNNVSTAMTNAIDLSGTAATVLEATLVSAQQSIAKDSLVSCDLVLSGGSSPTLTDITVVLWAQRRN